MAIGFPIIFSEIDKAKKRGATRKQLVKGRKFQRVSSIDGDT